MIEYPFLDEENEIVYFSENTIVNQWVETKWVSSTTAYYKNLGYKYTKQYDSFWVDVRDLPKGSNVKVTVYCPVDMESREVYWYAITKVQNTICVFHANFVNRKNKRYGRLIALECLGRGRWNNYDWLCECDCGNFITVNSSHLQSGSTQSCGCLSSDNMRQLAKSQVGSNSPTWKGGSVGYYGPNWRKQRKLARKRDNHECQRCGINKKQNGRALDVHHIKTFRSFNYISGVNKNYLEANDLNNLITLCAKNGCHMLVENNYQRLFDYSP